MKTMLYIPMNCRVLELDVSRRVPRWVSVALEKRDVDVDGTALAMSATCTAGVAGCSWGRGGVGGSATVQGGVRDAEGLLGWR